MFRFLFFVLFIVGSCGGSQRAGSPALTVQRSSLSPYSAQKDCVQERIQETKDGAPRVRSGDIVLFPSGSMDGCDGETSERYFSIGKGSAQRFVLYGKPNQAYCVGVERFFGYIVLSHFKGDVSRNGDMFMWCLVTQTEKPVTMAVQSLTPESSFRLVLF